MTSYPLQQIPTLDFMLRLKQFRCYTLCSRLAFQLFLILYLTLNYMTSNLRIIMTVIEGYYEWLSVQFRAGTSILLYLHALLKCKKNLLDLLSQYTKLFCNHF